MRIQENTDILLINVPMDRLIQRREEAALVSSMPPIGILYIISYLEKYNYKVSFIDLSVEVYEKQQFVEVLRKANPKVVGMSTYVESWNIQNALAKQIKMLLNDVIIVAGGHCGTFCFTDMLKYHDFDFIIKGEGEEAYKVLCDYYIKHTGNLSEVPNLVYLNEENQIIENEVIRMLNLEELPFPDRSVLDLKRYSYPFTISTARGCPGRCIFCSAHAFWGNRVVFRSPDNILAEIDQVYKQFGLRDFFIVDDTFTVFPKRTLEFCDKLDAYCKENAVTFKWACESRADVIDYNLMKKMKDTGCTMVQFGMESGNDEVLKSIKKNIVYDQVYNAVKIAHLLGISTNISFIIGHHSDTYDTINETIKKAVQLKNEFNVNIVFSINTPYPGTELRNNLKEYGVKLLIDGYDKLGLDKSVICTQNLTDNDIRKLYGKAQMLLN
jgi:radical SAM superfamily enzyme YgiQ (UPF0313 family)